MDLSTLKLITAFALITAGMAEKDEFSQPTSTLSPNCSCSDTTPAVPRSTSSSSELIMGLLRMNWTKRCEGTLYIYPDSLFNDSSLPLCYSPHINILRIVENVCQNERGCKYDPHWQDASRIKAEGFDITETGANRVSHCKTFSLKCKEVLPDVQTELQAYKVVTALFICLLLLLLFLRFIRPTVKALRKRLSDRRQHHWVGPTQSHSVSYHRGKAAVNTTDGEKRLSYPALERLMISDSSDA
ncbi:uncharacterized protein [Nothobranchius furzeri]|uniref:uncharacterized protein n=1 Tax=Nothobranchius furzeri TaxID=105023 RepID=UPI002403CE28|nr:uncharacterized protein LOC107397189 [Nothobranchius furzeri]